MIIRPWLPVLAAFAIAAPAAAQQLPNGASSLNETYGDWVVACQTQGTDLRCQMTQTQTESTSGQLFMAMEARPAPDGAMAATLLMPFGLALKQGVTLQLDEAAETMTAEFATCLPTGCLAPVQFDPPMVEALAGAKVLHLTVVAAEGQSVLPITVSLAGFAAAWARLGDLTR